MPRSHESVDSQFWDRVLDDNLTEVCVPVAASDPLLELAVRMGCNPKAHDGSFDVMYEQIVCTVAQQYGLSDGRQTNEMMNLYENDMRDIYGKQT